MSANVPTYMQGFMGFVMIDGSILGCSQSFSLSVPRSIQDIQCIGSDSIRKIAGPYSWSVSTDALQILTQDASSGRKTFDDIMAAHLAKERVTIAFVPNTTDVSTGQYYLSGTGIIESVDLTIDAGEAPATYSISIQGDGDLTQSATT